MVEAKQFCYKCGKEFNTTAISHEDYGTKTRQTKFLLCEGCNLIKVNLNWMDKT